MSARRAVPAAALAATVTFMMLHATVLGQGGNATATQAEPPHKVRVLVKDNYFEPRSVELVEGGHAGWKWKGKNRHNVRFTKVPRGASRKGAKSRTTGYWKRSFRRPGTYRYVCRHWAGMRGTITVRPEPKPKPES